MDTQSKMQAFVNGLSAAWQKERASTQMTLGEMIEALSAMPPDSAVANLRSPHSYRGYYCDLAFEDHAGTRPAAELLEDCKSCMGQVFEGYKGGDYVMGALTPVWIAAYGCCGSKISGFGADGSVNTSPDD